MTEEIKIKRKYAWIPDLPDHRDYMFGEIHEPTVVEKLPVSVDLRSVCSPVEDQLSIGSCTANALVGNLEFLEDKDKIPKFSNMSRLFVYYNERVIENTVNYDSGAMLRDGIKTLNKQGVCSEIAWPYKIQKFKQKPNSNCYKEGLTHTISSYFRINTLDEMKTCLADGFPFVFGFSVYSSFESAEVAKTGIVPMPSKNEQMLGGHAVLAVGFTDADKRFIARNSWGSGWGMSGYFTIPYDYLTNSNLANDFWTIRRAKGL